MTDRLTCHLNDYPYLPIFTLKTVGLCLFSVGWTSSISLGSSLVSLGFYYFSIL